MICCKRISIILLSLFMTSFAAADDPQLPQGRKLPKLINTNCIGDYEPLLPYLGRGSNFPEFLVSDINTALLNQSATSLLTNIKCTSEVDVKIETFHEKFGKQKLISSLELTFPLTLNVKNGNKTYQLEVAQRYKAVNLETADNRKASQVFEVKSQRLLTSLSQ